MTQDGTTRAAVLEQLAARIAAEWREHPLRVAIDGRDAAGKTTLADELAPLVERRGRPVVRASIDGFHRPRAERYRRGRESAAGYYLDSFDYDAVRRELLLPLGPGGSRRYRTAVFDVRSDEPAVAHPQTAPEDAVALVDGIFLCRPELDDLWDFRVFVHVEHEEAKQHDAARDRAGLAADFDLLYETRYAPGQQLYFDAVEPRLRADAVVDNSDLDAPRLRIRPRARVRTGVGQHGRPA